MMRSKRPFINLACTSLLFWFTIHISSLYFCSTRIQYVLFQTYLETLYCINTNINVHAYIKHIEAYPAMPCYSNSCVKLNSSKHRTLQNRAHSDRETLDRGHQKATCTTHHQKSARHTNPEANQDRTHVGLQDHTTSRNQVCSETETWSTLPASEPHGKRRIYCKPPRAQRRTNTKNIPNNAQRHAAHRLIRRSNKRTNQLSS